MGIDKFRKDHPEQKIDFHNINHQTTEEWIDAYNGPIVHISDDRNTMSKNLDTSCPPMNSTAINSTASKEDQNHELKEKKACRENVKWIDERKHIAPMNNSYCY